MSRSLSEKSQILKSASIISLVTIISRILGYLRDQRITLLLGTTICADSFVLAYRIPNLVRRLVSDGTRRLLIPVFTNYMRERSRKSFGTSPTASSGPSLSSSPSSPSSAWSSPPGDPDLLPAGDQCPVGTKPSPSIGSSSLISFPRPRRPRHRHSQLVPQFRLPHLHHRRPKAVTIIFSTGIVWPYFKSPAISLAVGVLVGGAFQFLMLVPQLVRRGMRFDFGISFAHRAFRDVSRHMFPRFFGLGISQINFSVDTYSPTPHKCRAAASPPSTFQIALWNWCSAVTPLPWPPPFCR